ncbi:nitroreductase family protein [Corynebacterium sp. ES2715-CONJ3]|uniref:nitroreductase family protein n=1 Tax=Corynebacterium sp. ES2715-CONJ3 TaxID=2974028 RepID=UPI002169EBD2|nr:nitroreductase family protein [Corynebacterium sp. ES2715-CONJ3]MCS4492184.1 nitroreductase family protein [Corynebacterium sp. ES2715-CONJ3]
MTTQSVTNQTVTDAIMQRRSVRSFTDEPVANELIDHIIALGLEAPSAFNAQRRDLVVVRDRAAKEAIFADSQQEFLSQAPILVVGVARLFEPDDLSDYIDQDFAIQALEWYREEPGRLRESAIIDATIASSFLLLAAQSRGLATLATTGWHEDRVLEAIGLAGRGDYGVAIVTAMGYSTECPPHPGRKANRRIDGRYFL